MMTGKEFLRFDPRSLMPICSKCGKPIDEHPDDVIVVKIEPVDINDKDRKEKGAKGLPPSVS